MVRKLASLIILCALSLSYCHEALAISKENKMRFLRAYTAQAAINRQRASSPYMKYSKHYKNLYQNGKISEKEYLDKMFELDRLETTRQQGITDRVTARASENRRARQMNDLIDAQSPPPQEPVFFNSQKRVTDQYGNTVGYIDQ